jgi:hypothetical protein
MALDYRKRQCQVSEKYKIPQLQDGGLALLWTTPQPSSCSMCPLRFLGFMISSKVLQKCSFLAMKIILEVTVNLAGHLSTPMWAMETPVRGKGGACLQSHLSIYGRQGWLFIQSCALWHWIWFLPLHPNRSWREYSVCAQLSSGLRNQTSTYLERRVFLKINQKILFGWTETHTPFIPRVRWTHGYHFYVSMLASKPAS